MRKEYDILILDLMREIDPELVSLRSWLLGVGREKREEALRRKQASVGYTK